MSHQTLIEVDELVDLIAADAVVLVDCRSELSDPDWGRSQFLDHHLPGARYVDLNAELSDLSRSATEGRHPLPDAVALARVLARLGVEPGRQVVAYDQGPGVYAARFWWLLRALGHRDVAVLNGGLSSWKARELPLASGAVPDATLPVAVRPLAQMAQAGYEELTARMAKGEWMLVDARSAVRFQGDEEPIDPVAGHVPGARNRPWTENLRPDGQFKAAAQLKQEWLALLGEHPPADVVHMCGSGVTACHNLLSMQHAGLGRSVLFGPSWSGWITDPRRPVARAGAN